MGTFEPHMRKADSKFLGFSGWACMLQRRFIISRVALRECAADFRIDSPEDLLMILVRHCSPRSAERTTRPSDLEVEHQMRSTDLLALVTEAKFDDDTWSDDRRLLFPRIESPSWSTRVAQALIYINHSNSLPPGRLVR